MDFFRFALCFFDRPVVSALACSPISSIISICTPNKKCASGKPFFPKNAGNHPINYALIATVAVLLVSLAGCGGKSANAEATVTIYNCGSGEAQTTACSTPSTTQTGTGTGTGISSSTGTGSGTGTETGVVTAPSAPTGVGASAADGQATVSWTASTGATSYNVYYSATPGITITNGMKVAGATSPKTITGLVNGTAYYFVVTAMNAGGESAVSGEVSARPQVPVSGAPSGVSAIAGDAQATISWTASTGATSYNVYYSATPGITITNGTKVAGATSPKTITGLVNGTAYYFVVTAMNAGGESAASNEVFATPTGNTNTSTGTGAGTGAGTGTGATTAILAVTDVSAGEDHTLILMSDGNVYAFGYNGTGGLGVGDTTNRTIPAKVVGFSNGTQVAAGSHRSFALKSDGTVWQWGGGAATPSQISGFANITKISATYSHLLALKNDGTVWALGANASGQLGDNTLNTNWTTAVQVKGVGGIGNLTGVTQIAAGNYHSLALLSTGAVVAWGNNAIYGALGDGATASSSVPVNTSVLTSITKIAAGANHSVALNSNGVVYAWGRNDSGQLGNGIIDAALTANATPAIAGGAMFAGWTMTDISAGYSHTLALRNTGEVWAFGSGANGRLGNNSALNSGIPVQAGVITGITKVEAGGWHSTALKNDGTLYTWGAGTVGQLGYFVGGGTSNADWWIPNLIAAF